jgi:hypothetical protein
MGKYLKIPQKRKMNGEICRIIWGIWGIIRKKERMKEGMRKKMGGDSHIIVLSQPLCQASRPKIDSPTSTVLLD